jgi:hypothetical protein
MKKNPEAPFHQPSIHQPGASFDTISIARAQRDGFKSKPKLAPKAELEKLREQVEALRKIEKAARVFITDSYRPTPKYDAARFDALAAALGIDQETPQEAGE